LRRTRPITLTIAALGGQGGGVVTDWLVLAARRAGYFVQATSVPGVAQRTGATIYYMEFFPRSEAPEGREPIMALMPNPGDVDVVVASEWMEAGRAINRGLVTKDRTTLIASTHRDYTIGEKIALGDGRASSRELFEVASAAANKLIGFDMVKVADAAAGRISAVILGAIAGADVLPWPIEHYHHAIKESGIGVEASLAGFEAGRRAVLDASVRPLTAAAWPDSRGTIDSSDYKIEALPAPLRQRIESRFPAAMHDLLGMAAARLFDYQDAAYSNLYLDRIGKILNLDAGKDGDAKLAGAAARSLGLWMSFEDVMRVAQVKTRRGRAERIRREVKAQPGELVQVREFVKPRVEEICGTLPAGLGRRLMASPRTQRVLSRFTAGRRISTSSISGFALLRGIAAMRHFRRATLRYSMENQRIEDWLQQIAQIAPINYELAFEVAECQTLVKGYGDTHERGWISFSRISALAPHLIDDPQGAANLRGLREAALADDSGSQLERAIASLTAGSSAAA
jgi:indolepyruvate ferredoxin oxidoreductase, beta subunit